MICIRWCILTTHKDMHRTIISSVMVYKTCDCCVMCAISQMEEVWSTDVHDEHLPALMHLCWDKTDDDFNVDVMLTKMDQLKFASSSLYLKYGPKDLRFLFVYSFTYLIKSFNKITVMTMLVQIHEKKNSEKAFHDSEAFASFRNIWKFFCLYR